jgi:hypothetical protein
MTALRAFQVYNSPGAKAKSRHQHDELVGHLFVAMRKDVKPRALRHAAAFDFGLFRVRPEERHSSRA